MANYNSIIAQYGEISPIDVDFMGKVLMAKQGQFDAGLAAMDESLAAMKQQENLLKRPEDKARFAANIQNILNTVNASGKLNFASKSITRDIKGQVGKALDDYTITQIGISQAITNVYTEAAEKQKKGDATFDTGNFKFMIAQAGVEDYLRGYNSKGEKVDSIGSLTYDNYVDVNKNALERIKQLKDIKGEQVIETQELGQDGQPTGQLIKRTIKGLTEDEIFQYFPNLLTQQESRQLDINGWTKYNSNMPQAVSDLNTYKDSKIKLIDDAIKYEETIVANSANSKKDIRESSEKIKAYNNQKNNFVENIKNIDITNPLQLGGFLSKQAFKSSIAEMAQSKWSTELEKDDYYFEKNKMELDLEKNERDKLEFAAKMEKDYGKSTDGSNILGADGFSVAAKEDSDMPDEIDTYNNYQNDYNKEYNNVVALSQQAYNRDTTSDEERAQFDAHLTKLGYKMQNGVVQVDNQQLANKKSKAAAVNEAFTRSKMNIYNTDIAKQISKSNIKRESIAKDLSIVNKEGYLTEFNTNSDRYITQLKDASERLGERHWGRMFDPREYSYDMSLMDSRVRTGMKGAIDKFVKDNGGWSNLPKNIGGDINKIKQLANLVDGAIEVDSTLYTNSRKNLNTLAKTKSGEILKNKIQSGKNAYINTGNVINVLKDSDKEKIISMIPQSGTDATDTFDVKLPLTFEKTKEGDIKITQSKGTGVLDGKGYKMPIASAIVSKEDDLYKFLLSKVEMNENERGLNATKTKASFRPMVRAEYIESEKEVLLSKAQAAMAQIPKNLSNSFKAHPAYFLTENQTKIAFAQVLKDKVEDGKISSFVDNLQDNLHNFKVELKPINGIWGIEVTNKRGDIIKQGQLGNMEILDEDVSFMVTNYPQVIISDAILGYLDKKPKEIDNILK